MRTLLLRTCASLALGTALILTPLAAHAADAPVWEFTYDSDGEWGPDCTLTTTQGGNTLTIYSSAEGFHPVLLLDPPALDVPYGTVQRAMVDLASGYGEFFNFAVSDAFHPAYETYDVDRDFLRALADGQDLIPVRIDFGQGDIYTFVGPDTASPIRLFLTCTGATS